MEIEAINEDLLGQIQKKVMAGEVRKEDEQSTAWFEDALKEGIVKFVYVKKDGVNVRTAYGTKNKKYYGLMPHAATAIMPHIKATDHGWYTIYYDMEKDNWRLFVEPFVIRVEKTNMTMAEMEAELEKDQRENREQKDAIESAKYSQLNKDNKFNEIPFLFSKEYDYPAHYEFEKPAGPRKKKKATAAPATQVPPTTPTV